MTSKRLTPAVVEQAKAEPSAERTIYWDEGKGSVSGFGLQVTAAGHKSFVYQYRRGGVSRRMKLDGKFLHHEAQRDQNNGDRLEAPPTGRFTLADAKREAEAVKGAVARGRDPLVELRKATRKGKDTFKAIAEAYLARPEARNLRTARVRRQVLERLVFPPGRLGGRPISEIRRSDVIRLLNRIEDENGAVMADKVFSLIRKVMNWHAIRDDDFVSPIVRGMRAANGQGRTRILTDDELRAVWRAAEAQPGPFGAFVQFLLLTGARRLEASAVSWDELVGADWTLPAARNKTKVDLIRPLAPAAMAVLERLPKIGKRSYVFTTDGQRPIGGFSRVKRRLDQASDVTAWTLHDLRRTARSLMSRAGVPADHAERCLGHVIGGVRGIYDRHEFHQEKRQAFEALAGLIERIVKPAPGGTVVPLRA
jgi:integrase